MSASKSKCDIAIGASTNTNGEKLLEDLTRQVLVCFNHRLAEKQILGQGVGSRQSLALQDLCSYILFIALSVWKGRRSNLAMSK